MELTQEQQAALDAANARLAARQQQEELDAAVPTQRWRTSAQGLTLGFSDEAEAAAVAALTGRPYEEVLAEVRAKIEAYKQARPLESLGYEAGGALVPAAAAAIAAPFTGGSSTAAVAPTVTRLALRGAAEGAAYAFGTGEGGFSERVSRVPAGAVTGAVAAPVGSAVVRGAGAVTNRFLDVARRTLGNRGATIVENEIQRIVAQTGKTADEIADDIINGRILAENETIRTVVRGYRAGGGQASTTIQRGMEGRPAETRGIAMEELRNVLGDTADQPAIVAQRRSDEAARLAENQAYAPFRTQGVTPEVESQVLSVLNRVPSAVSEVNKAFPNLVSEIPPVSGQGPNQFVFNRPITAAEAESIRRAVGNQATLEYRSGAGLAGEAFRETEQGLRSLLDASIPELASARAQAAAVRSQREAFEAGRSVLAGDIYAKLDDFAKLNDPEAIQAFRAGFLSALEARATTGGRDSLMRNLLNPEAKEYMALADIFPQDKIEEVRRVLETARGAQEATRYVMGGSPTTDTAMEIGRQGMDIGVSDVTGVLSGDVRAMYNVAANIASRFGRGLTEAERNRVAQILVSQDADLVRRAIQDDSAMAALQARVAEIMTGLERGAGRAAPVAVMDQVMPVYEETIRGLLAN